MPENITIKSDDIKRIAHGQAVVEATKQTEGDCRVLSVTATPSVRVGEVFTGEARYGGKVIFDCILVRDGKICCETLWAEFTDKITAPEIVAGTAASMRPEITNCEASIDAGVLKAVAVVDSELFGLVRGDCECLAEPESGIYCEKKKLKYARAVAVPTETVYVSDTLADVKATEALCAFSRAVITNAECGDDEIKVGGAVYTTVIVRTDDDLIASYKMTTPFMKSLTAQGADADCIATARACVSESTATFTAEPDGNAIELAVALIVDASAVKPCESEAVTDVFCADSEIECDAELVSVCAMEPLATVIDSVDGQVKLEENKPAADNVLCVANTFCTVTDSNAEDGRVAVEGLAGGDIIYYNAEKSAVDCIPFRIPFSMPLAIHTDSREAHVTATVTDVTVRVRRESVFDIKAETAFTAQLATRDEERVIKSVKRGEPIDRPNATVIVHIAGKGETLWQAAKALGCSPERVEEQNSAPAPYAGGERLVNFCSK